MGSKSEMTRYRFVVAGMMEGKDEREVKMNLGQLLADGGIRFFALKVDKDEKKEGSR
jgi:hypothetical protein